MTSGEVVTDTGALAALVSPWWLPALQEVSRDAALILPVLGALWLAVQIAIKIHQTYWKRK